MVKNKSVNGWMGKVLDIDLTDFRAGEIDTQPYTERFLGGRGLASRLYWETVKPETKAFDPENRLIFMAGPLVATGAQGASRLSVIGKSPMTYPEGFCYGNIGGFAGAELKKAGFDGIMIQGQAARPVYLWIHDNEVEIRDASEIWGQNVFRTEEILKQIHGEKARVITTGIAGEKKVRTAIIWASHQSTSNAGFGAVMGAKNLKAIVISGTGKPLVADPDNLRELNRYTSKISTPITLAAPPLVMATGHGDLVEAVGKDSCYLCGLKCNRQLYRYGQRLEGPRRCQSMEYYLPWKYSQENEPVDTFFEAPALANDYSIDTFELQSMVDWMYKCYKSGVLTEEETDLPLSKIGTRGFLEKLLHTIAFREGFGDILAEGLVRAREKISEPARDLMGYEVAPICQNDLAPPRAIVAHALIYPLEPRIHQATIHEITFVRVAWMLNQRQPELSPIDMKALRRIARIFWGSEEAADLSSYDGKALAAKKIQDRTYIKDSLGLCDFAWPIAFSFTSPDYVGDPDLDARIFSAVTGVSSERFDQYGDRICNQQRAILLREGRKVPEADYPPEFNFTEPLQTDPHGAKIFVPGPDGELMDGAGKVLDRSKFTAMLKEYYRLRGWDEEIGLLRVETLTKLGMADLAERKSPALFSDRE